MNTVRKRNDFYSLVSREFPALETRLDFYRCMEFFFISEFVSHSGGGNEWKLVDVANNSQRGSNERVKGKMEKIKWFVREATRRDALAELGVSPEDRDEVQRLKEALQETQAAIVREREQAEVRIK